MGENSAIQWTHHTFNPWRGCTKVSAGCKHCYAETLSKRNPGTLGVWGDDGTRVVASHSYWLQPVKWNRDAALAGERRRVFCASLADVFEDRPELIAPRARLWQTILYSHSLDWLLLTKRPENVVRLLKQSWEFLLTYQGLRDDCLSAWIDGSHPPDNVWLGVSVEDQAAADERIPVLLGIPAAVRFLSMEPLLGPVDLGDWDHECGDPPHGQCPVMWPDWVIVGGESGAKARPFDLAWARSIVAQCEAAGASCFVKQFGSHPVGSHNERMRMVGEPAYPDDASVRWKLGDSHGGDPSEWPADLRVRQFPATAKEVSLG